MRVYKKGGSKAVSEFVIQSDSARFEADVLKSPLPVVVYFYSEDCLPCTTFSQIYERAAVSLAGQMRFVRIFRSHNRQLADRYNVKSSPTVMFFKDGEEICVRLAGYIHYPEFKQAVENVIEKACPSKERSIVRCDVLIIGAGPAGLTSAIYASRSRLHTVVIDSSVPGGQVATTFHVSNYPGTNGEVRGFDLMENMKKQALSFGAQIDDMQSIREIRLEGPEKFVKTDQNDYYAKAVIIATGAEPRKLPVEGEREFRGRGIHYCATCDGALYMDADVIVVGGGTSAIEEAMFLTRYARTVTIVNRSNGFKASRAAVEEAMRSSQISVLWNTIVKEVRGESFVTQVVLEDTKTTETRVMQTDGLFVYIGMQPNTTMLNNLLDLSPGGYILTDEKMQTRVPGVFAAGDVREKDIRQISTAVGDGTIAGIMAERFITLKG